MWIKMLQDNEFESQYDTVSAFKLIFKALTIVFYLDVSNMSLIKIIYC